MGEFCLKISKSQKKHTFFAAGFFAAGLGLLGGGASPLEESESESLPTGPRFAGAFLAAGLGLGAEESESESELAICLMGAVLARPATRLTAVAGAADESLSLSLTGARLGAAFFAAGLRTGASLLLSLSEESKCPADTALFAAGFGGALRAACGRARCVVGCTGLRTLLLLLLSLSLSLAAARAAFPAGFFAAGFLLGSLELSSELLSNVPIFPFGAGLGVAFTTGRATGLS